MSYMMESQIGESTYFSICYYSGPDGARVKVPPLFFVITRGRKAPESRFRLCFLLLLGAGRCPSQGSASVFCYYSGPEGTRVKISAPFFVRILGVPNFPRGYTA